MKVFDYNGKQIVLSTIDYLSSSLDGKERDGRFSVRTDRLALVLKDNSFVLIEGSSKIRDFLKVWVDYKLYLRMYEY
jgi:hypothetical protein